MRRLAFAAVAACVSLSAPAAAQPERTAAEEVATLERRAADRLLSLREREAAADRAIELRRALIAAAQDTDPDLPGRLFMQAETVLARLARDGSDTAALFGIPTPAQHAAVREAAEEALSALSRAARIVPPDPEDGVDVRIPFFRARAEVLLASLAQGDERARRAQAALDAVGKVGLSNPGPEAARRVVVGAALLLRSPEPPRADAGLALEEFAWAAMGGDDPARPDAAISAITRAEGWLGLVAAAGALGTLDTAADRLREALAAPPFTTDRPDPLLAVLAADTLSRAWFEWGLRTGSAEYLDRAAAAQSELLARTDLGFRADVLRPAALDKLARLADAAPATTLLPAPFELARAIRAAREPGDRAQTLERFRRIADRPDAGPAAADALWELAVLLMRPGAVDSEHHEAVAALVRLARDHRDHPRAAEAMSAALSYARILPGGRDAYSEALVLATDEFPELPRIDVWRYERGRLAAEEPGEAVVRAALESMRRITTGSADSVKLHERLQASLLDSMRARLREARARSDAPAVQRLAREELEPEARRAADWAAAHGSALLPRFRADLADAMTDAGNPRAAGLYTALLARAHEIPGGAPRLRLGHARALLSGGDSARAFPLLRDAAAALDAPDSPSRSEGFWHAWTLMLEILAREATGNPGKAGTIRAHIRRLESVDPALGGEPWRTRIHAVRTAIGP